MATVMKSAGEPVAVLAGTPPTPSSAPIAPLPFAATQRDGSTTIRELIHIYMAQYAGRDTSRVQRLAWWSAKRGDVMQRDLNDDSIHFALEDLASQQGRYYAGEDADGKPIFRAKGKPISGATINRYNAALSAVLSWSIKKRIAPPGWANPCSRIERRKENPGVVRFLSDEERISLLAKCRMSSWPMLYALVLMGITTGARRGELERLRWRDLDFSRNLAAVHKAKNDDPKMLPLVPAVVDELRRHEGAPLSLVFASTRRPDVAYNSVSAWKAALKAAGVRKFRFHDLRHTCASYLAQEGATLLEIANVLGQRQLSMAMRYSHLTVGNKSKLVNRVLGEIK